METRVSNMLRRHGRVYSKTTTWTAKHHRWLSAQHVDEPASSLVRADLVVSVDGLIAGKAATALKLSQLATDELRWPTRRSGERFGGSTR